MSDYLDEAPEAQWRKPTPELEFSAWERWTWPFQTPPF
jgi:hypothetical protein